MKWLLGLTIGLGLSFSTQMMGNEDYPEMDPKHANQEQMEQTHEVKKDKKESERTPSSIKNDEIEGPDYPSFMGF